MIEVVDIDGWICPAHDVYFGRRKGVQEHSRAALEAIDAAQPHLRDRRLAVDVGAHIGIWTRPLSERFENVIAFEPETANYTLLLANAGGAMNVKAFPLALCPRNMRVEMHGKMTACYYAVEANGHIGDPWTLGISLDIMDLPYLDLLKLDVEGLEIEVIEGARVTIDKCRPVIIFEDGLVANRYNGHQRGDVKALLEKDFDYQEVARVRFMDDQDDVIMVPQ